MTIRFFIGLVTVFVMAGTAVAENYPDDMAWRYSQFTDPSNKGRMTSQAVLGVPETDWIMGYASCFAGSTAGLPELVFPADTGGAGEGTPIGIEFMSDAGPIFFEGTVKAPQSEEDFSGVRINPDMVDPIWNVLMRMNFLTYRVRGQAQKIPLTGSRAALSALLADCRAYHGNFNPNADANAGMNAGGGQAPVPQPPVQPAGGSVDDPRWATCDQYAGVRSQNSDTPVNLTFVNQSDGYRAVMWIGFDGMPKEYASLNQGESFSVQTFLTHPWMFTDGPGNCIEMFMPQLGVSQFNITAPGRNFGPE